MLTTLLAAVLLAAAAPGTAPNERGSSDSAKTEARLHGRVVDDVLDQPLARAVVWLAGDTVLRTTTTGVDGTFAFPDLPAGSYVLEVRREAYDSASISIVVPSGREVVVDVQLARRPDVLAPVIVQATSAPEIWAGGAITAGGTSGELEEGAGRALRTLDLLSHAGSMLAGPLGASEQQRPPQQGGGNGHTLFVWGTDDERGRVLLDGAVISAPLHLGGLLPSIDPALIDEARIRTGGAPARFDGGTGYVLELSTRAPPPGSLRMWGESNLLTDRVGGEVAVGSSGSILAGARRVRTEMLPRLSGVVRGYSYNDLLARASLRTGDDGRLRATFFETDEALRIPRDQGSDEAAWRNRAGSLAWQSESAGELSAVRLSMSRAITDLPLLSAFGGHLRGDVDYATISASRRWEEARWHWGVGGEVEHARFGREARITPGGAPASDSSDIRDLDDGPCGAAYSCVRTSSTTAALYGDLRYEISERARLAAGLRIASTPSDRATPLVDALPRLALEASVAPRTSVRLAAGRYSRLGAIFSAGADDPADGSGGAGTFPQKLAVRLARDHATQLELSATHRWGRTALGLATYLHHREGNPSGTHLDHAVGIDASLSYSGKWLSAAASYTHIARSYEVAAPSSGTTAAAGESRPRFGVERLVSLNGTVSAGRLSLSLSGAYARGIPYTSIVLDRPTDAFLAAPGPTGMEWRRDDAPLARSYLRLDATLSGTWCIGERECPVQLSPYVRVINALDRRDALFYYQDGDLDMPRSLAALPAVLSVGVRWEVGRAPR